MTMSHRFSEVKNRKEKRTEQTGIQFFTGYDTSSWAYFAAGHAPLRGSSGWTCDKTKTEGHCDDFIYYGD